MRHTYNGIDRLALAISGTLMLLGIVVLGFLEVLDGAPFGAAPLTNDAGDVVATPLIDPNVRTGLVVAGLLILLLWGLYRMYLPTGAAEETPREATASH